jgi:hypothetical protein
VVNRRIFLAFLPALAAAESKTAIRGTLLKSPECSLRTSDGRVIAMRGEDDIMAVLRDARVIGLDFEAEGAIRADGVFEIAPIYQAPLFVYKGGKRLFVTYWCDVCAIRTQSPGICWCCREDTEFDPRDRKD